jgi:hypothetical protein
MGDFLHMRAPTPHVETYRAAGAAWRMSTNSKPILRAAGESFQTISDSHLPADLALRLWVDPRSQSRPPWPKPYVRGLEHLVYAGFSGGNSLIADLHRGRVTGRFSAEFAADTQYWNRIVFPMLLSITAASLGITEVHCACVAKDGYGLLLAGPTRSGKSTLSMALTQSGYGFLADDRTFCSLRDRTLSAYGFLTDLKLRNDSISWFPDAKPLNLNIDHPNQSEFRLRPESLGLLRARQCEPRLLIFLKRHGSTRCRLVPLAKEEAANRLEADLMVESPEALLAQRKVISLVAALPCFVLHYGGTPQAIAKQLASYIRDAIKTRTAPESTGRSE